MPTAQPEVRVFFFEFLLVIGLALGAHNDDLDLVVVLDRGDPVVRKQHALVQEIAQREILRIVADAHDGDDLLRV